jgi:hypothetical protein
MGKEDKWERERDREYIIVWKRERNLSREEKEEEEKKKKKRREPPKRRKEPWRALPETHVRWKTLLGRRSREGSFFSFPFSMCASHFFFQSPSNIENGWVRNTSSYSSAILSGKGGTPTQLLLLSLAFFFYWYVCVCMYTHTYVHVPLFLSFSVYNIVLIVAALLYPVRIGKGDEEL